jgi:hypothetical protein
MSSHQTLTVDIGFNEPFALRTNEWGVKIN